MVLRSQGCSGWFFCCQWFSGASGALGGWFLLSVVLRNQKWFSGAKGALAGFFAVSGSQEPVVLWVFLFLPVVLRSQGCSGWFLLSMVLMSHGCSGCFVCCQCFSSSEILHLLELAVGVRGGSPSSEILHLLGLAVGVRGTHNNYSDTTAKKTKKQIHQHCIRTYYLEKIRCPCSD